MYYPDARLFQTTRLGNASLRMENQANPSVCKKIYQGPRRDLFNKRSEALSISTSAVSSLHLQEFKAP